MWSNNELFSARSDEAANRSQDFDGGEGSLRKERFQRFLSDRRIFTVSFKDLSVSAGLFNPPAHDPLQSASHASVWVKWRLNERRCANCADGNQSLFKVLTL
jgi:hypothetical protein